MVVAELSLEQLKKENLILKRELNAAMMTVDKLLKDANKQREEIASLQTLVSQTVPVLNIPKTPSDKTDAQVIADNQLERLKAAALIRQLTLEEVRIYDFLVKNQRLSNQKVEEPKSSYRDVSDVELLKLAESTYKIKDEEN